MGMNKAKCTGHMQCPDCASQGKDTRKDNLGVFDDGSTYCFSCGYVGSLSVAAQLRKSQRKDNVKNKLFLPSGNTNYDNSALIWFDKYDISLEQAEKHGIRWSEEKKALIFPYYNDKNELIFYQLRYFSGPKRWKSMGVKPLIYLGKGDTAVLVEDIISAIKVSQLTTAIPLFGSNIDIKKLLQIRKQYDNITIWLDYDKANDKQTKKIIATCKAIFKKTNQIITEKDPKTYSTEEIRIKLSGI